jgi:hypothetical protein
VELTLEQVHAFLSNNLGAVAAANELGCGSTTVRALQTPLPAAQPPWEQQHVALCLR